MDNFSEDIRPETLRLAKVLQAVLDLFDNDVHKSLKWLRKPQRGLGGKIPLEVALTESGAKMVINLIGRISWGVLD